MILERSMNDTWLSNTYLIADQPGGAAAFIDAGGPVDPLVAIVERDRLHVSHVLLTHHHYDHVAELERLTSLFPEAQVLIHPLEQELVSGATGTIEPGDELKIGVIDVKSLHTPGHTAGMLSFLAEDYDFFTGDILNKGSVNLFTGDTLFKGSVGGVRGPDHTTFGDLKSSIMDVLMALPPETVVRPGHAEPTTIGEQWEENAFVRVWRGLDPEGDEPCTALGKPATLILNAPDYDGGTKAWVRWPDGSDDIVPGSQIS